MDKITPFLWYDNQAEEAANFYVSVFKNSKLGRITHWSEEAAEKAGQQPGSVLTVEFTLDGVEFAALNGGPMFEFNESVSFMVNCETQDEVDYYWEKLSEGGEKSRCGWLKDKFGLSWQVTPIILPQLLADPDKAKASRVMNAMMEMEKIDIAALQRAYEEK